MTPEARKIRDRLSIAEREVEAAKSAVARLEATCHHAFSPPVSDPIIHPGGYATPQHWHPGYGREEDCQVWIDERRDPRWRRTCTLCGRVEYTTKTDQHVTHTPKF